MMTPGATICVAGSTFSFILAVISSTLCASFLEALLDIYRAVPRGRFEEGEVIGRKEGRRLPGNVPYFVDNLWEFTRPDHLPSRRHALYARPTPELALQNASAAASDGYVACRIVFREPPLLYQLPVQDARLHEDIGVLQKYVNRMLVDWSGATLPERQALSTLFLPGTANDELASAMAENDFLREIVDTARGLITFWNSNQVALTSDGELFFELINGNTYTLLPIE